MGDVPMAKSKKSDLISNLEQAIQADQSKILDHLQGVVADIENVRKQIDSVVRAASNGSRPSGALSDETRKRISELERLIEERDRAVDKATAAEEQSKQALDERAEAARAADAAKNRIAQLERDLAGSGAASEDSSSKISNLESDASKLQDKIVSLEQKLAEKVEALNAAKERISKLERELGSKADDIPESAIQVITNLEQRVQEHVEADKHAKREIARLQKEVGEKAAEIPEAVKSQLAQLDQELNAARDKCRQYESEAQALKSQVDEAKRKIAHWEQHAGDLENQVAQQKVSAEAHGRKSAELGKALDDAESRNKSLEADLAKSRDECTKADNRVGELQHELTAVEERAKTAARRVSEVEENDRVVREEIEKLRAELARTTENLQSAEAERDDLRATHAEGEERIFAAESTARTRVGEMKMLLKAEKERADLAESKFRQETSGGTKTTLAQQLADALEELEAAKEEVRTLRAKLSRSTEDQGETAPADPPKPLRGRDQHGNQRQMGTILVDSGVISEEQLEEALTTQRSSGNKHLGQILVEKNFASESVVVQAMACQFNVLFVRLSEEDLDSNAVKLVSKRLAEKHGCIPLRKKDNALVVAMANPIDLIAIEDVQLASNLSVEPVAATSTDIAQAIAKHYAKPED